MMDEIQTESELMAHYEAILAAASNLTQSDATSTNSLSREELFARLRPLVVKYGIPDTPGDVWSVLSFVCTV
jgi:hypothetical protein